MKASVGSHPEPLGEDALGLLDDDPAVQCDLQLTGHELLLVDRAFLQYPDRGYIDERPGRPRDGRVQAVGHACGTGSACR